MFKDVVIEQHLPKALMLPVFLGSILAMGCGYQMVGHSAESTHENQCIGDVEVIVHDGLVDAQLSAYIRGRLTQTTPCDQVLNIQLQITRETPTGLTSTGRMSVGTVQAHVSIQCTPRTSQPCLEGGLKVTRPVTLGGQADAERMAFRDASLLVGRIAVDNALRRVSVRHTTDRKMDR